MIKQIKTDDLPKAKYDEVIDFSFSKEEFSFTKEINWDVRYSGLSDAWVAGFYIEETKEFFFLGSSFDMPNVSALLIPRNDNLSKNIEIIFDSFKLNSKLIDIAIDVEFLNYDLLRQDDNGNIYKVSQHLCKQDAYIEENKFATKLHKQTYWIEESKQNTLKFINN